MTATERLRVLLDERGAEWHRTPHYSSESIDNETVFRGEGIDWIANDHLNGHIGLRALRYEITPEQAIAATLGSCNCSNSERTETCRLEGFADVPFSVDYEIEGYDMGSSRDYATLAECSSCGAYVIVPPEYHHVLTCDGDEVYQPYRFCPNCGRRIEVDDG